MIMGHEKESSETSQQNSGANPNDSRSISNTLVVLDSNIKTNPFGANVTGDNSYRRAERIGAALHLVTNHVPEVEPLRIRVRAQSISLLEYILDLRTGFRAPSEKGQRVSASIRELISLVRLLAVAGYVSAENVQALAEALDELGNLIVVSQRSTLAEQHTVTREDLMPSAQHIAAPIAEVRKSVRHVPKRRPIKDIKDTESANVSNTASARNDQILDILKLGGMLGIKDISANLPQYSEKMIQRQLADLVTSQKVIKVGSKRWSRYRIAGV